MTTEPHFPGTGPHPHPHPHPYYYQYHWRGYRPRGPTRLVWFVIGAGAATLYYRGKHCHRDELGAGYPSNSANGGAIATTPYEERQMQLREREWNHWHWPTWREREREREAWRAREEARAAAASTVAASAPVPVVAAFPSSPAQAPPTPAAPPMNNDEKSSAGAFWEWTQTQDPVRGATDAMVDLTESGLDSLIATINGLKLKLKAAEARASEAEEKTKRQDEEKHRKLV